MAIQIPYFRSRTVHLLLQLALSVSIAGCAPEPQSSSPAPQGRWLSLFNGTNLDGWTAKISGHPAGINYADTFRVEDGLLKVRYDRYGQFGVQFGGLYYKEKFSEYWIRVEYRFVGELAEGAPAWATRDSGLLMHAQSPDSMAIDQAFPVSIELNMLGGKWLNRSTGDACTNSGMRIVVNGAILPQQCTNSSNVTIRGDEWVVAEAKVLGGRDIKHYINGQLVASYQSPQLDTTNPEAVKLLSAGSTNQVSEGYIALQSNGHPVDVRKIEIFPLAHATP